MAGAPSKSSRPPGEPDLRGQMAGEYRIVRRIGAGGFGTVYEAEHPVLKRKAAVKVLHANRSGDSPAVLRFFAEAQAASQIRHRHMVDIFSFGKLQNGQHFYVMDLLEGAPLDEFLKQQTHLDPGVALPLLRPIAEALDALHGHGIVHRDVKPPNIYLAWESNDEVVPKLLDFGLVKLLTDSPFNTASGVPMGTPYYMSPEQCRGEKVDARSDVYAFGIICHEMLSGRPPFTGDTPAAVLVAHVVQPPPRLSESRPDLPASLDQPILNMLAKDPAARPSSVGEGLRELERAAREAGIDIPDRPPHLERIIRAPVENSMEGSQAENPAQRVTAPARTLLGRAGGPVFWLIGAAGLAVGAVSLYSLLGGPANGRELAAVSSSASGPPAPAEAPVLPSAALPPAPSANPKHAELTLKGAPPGARLMLGNEQLGVAPGPIALPYGDTTLELTLVMRGYETKTLHVVPNGPLELEVTLSRPTRVGTGTRGAAVPKDLENPF